MTMVKVEGHPKRYLKVNLTSACGEIDDGISFAHWGSRKFESRKCEGGWVVSFRDLERIYKAAQKARS